MNAITYPILQVILSLHATSPLFKYNDASPVGVLNGSASIVGAGRALEELRSSLHNELRTSEGAKRQQQRMCGPAVAMTFNFLVSVGIILTNKSMGVQSSLLPYLQQYITLIRRDGESGFQLPNLPTPFSSIFALGAVMSFATGLSNTSLQHNSVGFYQMVKIAVTPTIVLSEFVLFRKMISCQKVLALAMVSFCVAIATVTDLEFNLSGAFIAAVWMIPSAINKILWSNLQQKGNRTALALMWKTTPITIFFLLPLIPWLDPPGVLSFKWDLYNTSAVLVSALLGFLLQWSGALAVGLVQQRPRRKVQVLHGCPTDELLKIMDYSSLPHFCRESSHDSDNVTSDDCFSFDHNFHQQLYNYIKQKALLLNWPVIKQGSVLVTFAEPELEEAKIDQTIESEFHRLGDFKGGIMSMTRGLKVYSSRKSLF
ncbi:hypothetical protein SAY87_002924 [Trapa incisa]|uniref:Sugar phosphate transporter domain-containing protein n=1 Tax=Trapa incisa TaxID=236973 RepID=A0AAN7KN88_9MYRT|nr:hypothetical protein SAY87_002924 [Trapa incisa]